MLHNCCAQSPVKFKVENDLFWVKKTCFCLKYLFCHHKHRWEKVPITSIKNSNFWGGQKKWLGFASGQAKVHCQLPENFSKKLSFTKVQSGRLCMPCNSFLLSPSSTKSFSPLSSDTLSHSPLRAVKHKVFSLISALQRFCTHLHPFTRLNHGCLAVSNQAPWSEAFLS